MSKKDIRNEKINYSSCDNLRIDFKFICVAKYRRSKGNIFQH